MVVFLGSPFCPRPAAHFRVNFTVTLDYLLKTSWPKANSLKGKPAERLIHLVDQCSQTALRRGSEEGSVEANPGAPSAEGSSRPSFSDCSPLRSTVS